MYSSHDKHPKNLGRDFNHRLYLMICLKIAVNLELSKQVNNLISHSTLIPKLPVRDPAVEKSLEHRQVEMMMLLESVEVHYRSQLLVIANHNKVLNRGWYNCHKLTFKNFSSFFHNHNSRFYVGCKEHFKVFR